MSDEGFHEIQLNGKQLVFLFMAATVVSVVIFLCGVMVGRGVRTGATTFNDGPEQASLDPTAVNSVRLDVRRQLPSARRDLRDRREAESVAGRLEREEQFKPWVSR